MLPKAPGSQGLTSLRRLPNFRDLPTVAETIPGFIATGWFALLAPTGTPEPIIHQVSQDLRNVIEMPEGKKKLADLATFTRPMSPEETTAFVRSERETWKPVVRQIGFGAQ